MKLVFAGDFCPFEGFVFDFAPEVRELFAGADYSFVNLECPLTDSALRIKKIGPNLKATPAQIEVISKLGVNCLTLANNHILDYGSDGMRQTIKICKDHNIKTVGTGENISEARVPLYLQSDGIKVSVINVAEEEFCIADEHSPGGNPFDIINLIQDIETARRASDMIVVVVHGGLEYANHPSPESIRRLRFIADQKGVVAVIRHHPHVVQCLEKWNGCPIYYSLGNFCFPTTKKLNEMWYKGLVVELDISDNKVMNSHSFVFSKVNKQDFCVSVHKDNSNEIKRIDCEASRIAFYEEAQKRKLAYLNRIFLPSGICGRIASKLQILNKIPPSDVKRRVVMNLVRCEAHRELLLRILDERKR